MLLHLLHLNVHSEQQVLGEKLLWEAVLKVSRLLGTSGSNLLRYPKVRHLSLCMVNTEKQGTARAVIASFVGTDPEGSLAPS